MTGNLHSFFVYVFFGNLLLFPMLLFILCIFRVRHPRQRMTFYMVALMTPIAGYILYHTLLLKRCESGLYQQGMMGKIVDAFCLAGNLAAYYLGPLLVAMLLLGVTKAAVSLLYVARLKAHACTPDSVQEERVFALLLKRARELHLSSPAIIFSDRSHFAAFAAGVKRPQIVVSLPVIESLSDQELDGVLTHELVHIRRRDTVYGWILSLLRDIMFFSPFSSALLRRYLQERECLCDLQTVQILGAKKVYAATLLHVSGLLTGKGRVPAYVPSGTAGFIGGKSDLELRIIRLLSAPDQNKALPGSLLVLLMSVFMLTVIVYMGMIC